MENVKEKILFFVQSVGLTKAEIARQLGISKSNFVGEAMASDLNVSIVIKFCQLYPQVSAEWLLRGTGDMLITADGKSENIVINNSNMGHHNTNIGSGTQTIVTKQEQTLPRMSKEEALAAIIKQNADLIDYLKQ